MDAQHYIKIHRQMLDLALPHTRNYHSDVDFIDITQLMYHAPDKFFWCINGDSGSTLDSHPLQTDANDIAIRPDGNRLYYVYKAGALQSVTHAQWRDEVLHQPWLKRFGPLPATIPNEWEKSLAKARRRYPNLFSNDYAYYLQAHQHATRFYVFTKMYDERVYIAANDHPYSLQTARYYINAICRGIPRTCHILTREDFASSNLPHVKELLAQDQQAFN